MESIIGKQYKPHDNSFSVNVTEVSANHTQAPKRHYLAGTLIGQEQRTCDIISDPFPCRVQRINKQMDELYMIMVNYEGNTHMVMFHPDNVI